MTQRHPQAIAWSIVLTAFVCFSVAFAASAWSVYWFLFRSPVTLTAQITVSRGTIGLQTLTDKRTIADARSIEPRTAISVPEGSQGILSFQDTYSKQTVVSITLTENTNLVVTDATRPRFEFSRQPYSITLDNADGQLIVNAPPTDRAFLMDVNTEVGTAHLIDDGRYTITTDPDPNGIKGLQLFNQGGAALLLLASRQGQQVQSNQIGHAWANKGEIEMGDPPYQLLASALFESQKPVPLDTLPDGWNCVAPRGDLPGYWFRDADANYVLRMQRGNQDTTTPGETSCITDFNTDPKGLDTSRYSSIRLLLRIKLLQQNLPVCGFQASECPVMVEIQYVSLATDSNPNPDIQKWNHGFYYLPKPRSPLTCATCRVEHERLNQDVWYFYDSGDLKPQLGDPAPFIRRLSVYSSGHQYDVLIAEVALVGIPKT